MRYIPAFINSKLGRSLLLSAAIHVLLIGLVLLDYFPGTRPTPSQGPYEVSLRSGNGSPAKKRNSKGPGQNKTPSYKDLKLGLSGTSKDHAIGSRLKAQEPQDGFDIATSIDAKGESKLYPFFQALWREIDAATSYPDDLTKMRITGKVTVQLAVDSRGVFTGRFVSAIADSEVLKTYAMAALVYALHRPLPKNLWSDREETVIVTHFNFDVFSVGEAPHKQEIRNFKNILAFDRLSYVDPKLNEVVHTLFTRYLPPILPIPGGAYIDFVRAYELATGTGKITEEEARRSRYEYIKILWEQTILWGSAPAVFPRQAPGPGQATFPEQTKPLPTTALVI